MDEPSEQAGSNSVFTDFDCDPPVKNTAEEEVSKLLFRKSSSDACKSDAVIDSPNTNGIEEESEAHVDGNVNKHNLGSTQSVENDVQEKETSNYDQKNESKSKFSASSEDFSAVVKACNDNTNNTVNDILVSSVNISSVEKDINTNVMALGEDNEEVNVFLTEKTVSISKNQSSECNESDKRYKQVDLQKDSEFSEQNDNTINCNKKLTSEEKNREVNINDENKIINLSEEKYNNNKSVDSSKQLVNDKLVISFLEELPCQNSNFSTEVNNEIEKTELSKEGNNQTICELDVKDVETTMNEIDTSSGEITQLTNQLNEKIREISEKDLITPNPDFNLKCKEISEKDLPISNENLDEKLECFQSDKELNKELDTSSLLQSDINNKKVKADTEIRILNDPSLKVNSNSEALDKQEKKVDHINDNENSQKDLETLPVESEKENTENKNDSVQDDNNCQSIVIRLSTSGEQEENINKSEDDGNDVMDTEMVNCNEIEQIDLSENETDLKNESRDEEMVADLLETAGDKNSEDQINDGREDSREMEKSAVLTDDEGTNQPGDSEEETITGDTINQSSTNISKEKEDEEVCIIPDDIPVLSILPQNKEDITLREEEKRGIKVVKVSPPELIKPKTRAQDKRNQVVDSKPRPVRNAAKLAGNKIKSLVESDLVFDDQALSGVTQGDTDIHENTDESAQMCAQCREVKVCKLLSLQNDITQYLCSEQCSAAFKTAQIDIETNETDNREFMRKCSQCYSQITANENRLFWETMDFCNEDCLGKYQFELGSSCCNCKKSVPSTSLGKYCVRFGYDIKQFCSALCLEEYKKGLKVCSYCQKDISTGVEGFLAPVGNKGQFKDFCTQSCMEKYDRMSSNKPLPEFIEECAVCSNSKPVQVEVELENKTHKLCSEPCFAAFKFVNNITEGQCDLCRKYFDRAKIPSYSLRLLFFDETLHSFCSKTCMNVYILANRKIVPCNWCKVKKYNFDMIKKVSADGQLSMMCSLNCLMLYQTSVNAVCSRPIKCDFCKKKFVRQPLYHLTMSDATLRNFCSYNCVMSFQNGYPKQKADVISGTEQVSSPFPTSGPKRLASKRPQVDSTCVPVISSVQSLASPNGPASPSGRVQISRGDVNIVPQVSQSISMPPPLPQVYQQIITKPAPVKQMKNKSVLCKPYSHTKGVSCRPHPCMKETQTDQSLNRKFLIPIPVPIYVPAPMHMFSTPFPVPVPFPLPVPVPIFIPTTRNSAKGIMKEIKKIQEKIPTDPFEAELLMMAEMVAGDKKQDPTDSESEDGNDADDNGDGTFSPENVDTSNTFGDDMLQMALKMASELEEPAVDMESVLTSNTITTSTQPAVDPNKALYASDTDDPDQVNVMAMSRGRKRSVRGSRNSSGGTPSKRGRRTSGSVDVPLLPPPEPVPPRTIEVEKPDANMCLKYTFGVNAWRHWVMQKNAELEKAALTNRKIKLFKPELLQLTADELNFSLCLFVKEVRKPNGTEYAPDTIYYLCLGIQQYLFENGRIDNIFTDSYYEKFTDCLDEVAKKFAALYNDSQYIVTRVEEEHLWESKQLGAHSPHVLLSTLMFFNTKHFNLVTVEEHMQLSFSHIMKHWKRNPNTPGVAKVPGSRNVLLRFYPPQSALEANSRKKKVYEQQENEENPLRCPVKLYEFYLSKCPESVKTRNDVFYLLPERSCVPDSPVWYSTMALGKEPLMKMLHRIKMVKEINIALLTS